MTNQEKLEAILSAINEVETFQDGSIIIRWKANVAHEIPGHLVNLAEGSNILKGHQVHFNPGLVKSLESLDFKNLQTDLDEGIKRAYEEKMLVKPNSGCTI